MIDLTIDFDALLEKAKAQYKIYENTVKPLRTTYDVENICFPPEIQVKLRAAYDKWMVWCQQNINNLGLELNCDMLGRPVGISACLAGRRY